MSSPEREKHLAALANLEQIQALLFKCDVRYLRHALRDLKDYIKERK